METQKIITTSALIAAVVTLGGFAWAIGDNTGYRPWLKREQSEFTDKQFKLVIDQTQQNTRALAQLKFDELWGLRKFGALTWDQKVNLCSLALTLNYTIVEEDGCRKICSDDGTPVLTAPSTGPIASTTTC